MVETKPLDEIGAVLIEHRLFAGTHMAMQVYTHKGDEYRACPSPALGGVVKIV